MSKKGKVFLYLVYFAIVAALSGIIITASKSNQPAPPKPAPAHHVAKAPVTPKTSSKKPAPAAVPSPSTTPTATPASAASVAATPTALTDTGPGDVAGLFVVVSLSGALLYRRRLIAHAG